MKLNSEQAVKLTPDQAAKNLAFFVYGGATLKKTIWGLSSSELWAQLDPAYQVDVLLLVNKWWGRMPKVRKKPAVPANKTALPVL
jgi:hypothetical protein